MARYFKIRSIEEVVKQYFSKHIGDDGDQEGGVRLLSRVEWVSIVGERIARHAEPLYIEHGVLVVKTDHAAWNHYILLNSSTIISSIRATIKDVFINSIRIKSV